MAKQKKNSNYVTEKNIAKKEALEEKKQKKERAKTIKTVAIISGAVVAFLAVLFIVLFACGVFEYHPKVTYDASLSFSDGNSLHFELYGEDAPKTVENFVSLCNGTFLKYKSAHTLVNGMLYFGATAADGGASGIKGEFSENGFDNKVKMEKGTICIARGKGYDSGYRQFFILTEDAPELQGKYAAFGKITDMAAFDKFLEGIKAGSDGKITNAPIITSTNAHTPESHSSHDGHNH